MGHLEAEVLRLRRLSLNSLADALVGVVADLAATYDNEIEGNSQAPGEHP